VRAFAGSRIEVIWKIGVPAAQQLPESRVAVRLVRCPRDPRIVARSSRSLRRVSLAPGYPLALTAAAAHCPSTGGIRSRRHREHRRITAPVVPLQARKRIDLQIRLD